MDFIKFDITESDLRTALKRALEIDFADNLRIRANFVKLDSKVRGYLGEICATRFLEQCGVNVLAVHSMADGGEDRDITVENAHGEFNVEVKTSLIPDSWRTLEVTMRRGDIKIIKRESDYHDIKADFYMQIYFNKLRKARDSFLESLQGSPLDYSVGELIEIMRLRELEQKFVAWVSKDIHIRYLDGQIEKTWKYGFRTFWKCPLTISREPIAVIDALKNYR